MESGRIISDLPFHPQQDIVIVQPKITLGMEKKEFLREFSDDDIRQGKDYFSRVFNSAASFSDLVHVGYLSTYSYSYRPGKPSDFLPCGGDLHAEIIPPGSKYEWLGRGFKIAVTCSHPECNMTLGMQLNRRELAEVMLHLMLKQMIPHHESCNFIDFYNWSPDSWWDSGLIERGQVENVSSLGVLAILGKLFFGYMSKNRPDNSDIRAADEFELGFVLMPSMDTLQGCGGFDKWLKYLVLKAIKFHHEAIKSLMNGAIGPKQMPRSVFWGR